MRFSHVHFGWDKLAPLALGMVTLLLAAHAGAQAERVARTTINPALIVWSPLVISFAVFV